MYSTDNVRVISAVCFDRVYSFLLSRCMDNKFHVFSNTVHYMDIGIDYPFYRVFFSGINASAILNLDTGILAHKGE